MSSLGESDPQHVRTEVGGRQGGHDVIHRFGMKVPAESLELRLDQDDVGVIDLLSGIPAAAPGPADGRMGVGDLIEFPRPCPIPPGQ